MPYILDTNILVHHWRRKRSRRLADDSPMDAIEWAEELIQLEQTDAIVTPVYIEVIGGTMDGHQLSLTRSYLGRFRIIDEGKILKRDWIDARRYAERITPRHAPKPRGAIDCLIVAIARRKNYEVRTFDQGMPD